jgi:hypothetical protein
MGAILDICRKPDSAARLAMHGRILRCPHEGNPRDCPLYEIRLLPIEERLAWIDSKTDEELQLLLSYHVNCLDKKTLMAGSYACPHSDFP